MLRGAQCSPAIVMSLPDSSTHTQGGEPRNKFVAAASVWKLSAPPGATQTRLLSVSRGSLFCLFGL
jgi:hypothetical protein